MKTHIVQLDPYDDVNSVGDKMAWGKSSRILLVWPDADPHILNRKLDLVLIKRRARELGSQLALVSRDLDVHYHADELSIPTFRDITQAQTKRWFRRRRGAKSDEDIDEEPFRPDLRSLKPVEKKLVGSNLFVRLIALLAGIFSILVLAAVLIPRAQIELKPETRTQELSFVAVTGPNITTLNASGAVPAVVQKVIVEGRQTVDSTGSIRVPSDPASGFVLFSNLTSESVPIDAGTVVLTGGPPTIRYIVTASGVLADEPGATVLLPVRAVLPGEDGNVEAGAVVAVEGLLGLELSVTNPDPIRGGQNVTLAAPTDEDRSLATGMLLEALRTTAAEELLAQLNPDDILLTQGPLLSSTQQETFLPADDSPSDIVEATLRLEFQILTVPWSAIEKLSQMVLDAGLEAGFEPIGNEIQIAMITIPEADENGAAEWTIQAARKIRSLPDAEPLLSELLGKTQLEAEKRLSDTMLLGAQPEIQITPGWWPRMPLLPIQIAVEIITP